MTSVKRIADGPMPLVLLLVFAFLSYGEFSLVAAVYRAIASRYDGASAVLLILLSFLFAIFLGARLIRHQGGSLLTTLRRGSGLGKDVGRRLLSFIAGILFIVPGYLSDLLALACLLPPTAWIVNHLALRLATRLARSSSIRFHSNIDFGQRDTSATGHRHDPTIIDVDIVESPPKRIN
jgi:UPF0716 protein FxsA